MGEPETLSYGPLNGWIAAHGPGQRRYPRYHFLSPPRYTLYLTRRTTRTGAPRGERSVNAGATWICNERAAAATSLDRSSLADTGHPMAVTTLATACTVARFHPAIPDDVVSSNTS